MSDLCLVCSETINDEHINICDPEMNMSKTKLKCGHVFSLFLYIFII